MSTKIYSAYRYVGHGFSERSYMDMNGNDLVEACAKLRILRLQAREIAIGRMRDFIERKGMTPEKDGSYIKIIDQLAEKATQDSQSLTKGGSLSLECSFVVFYDGQTIAMQSYGECTEDALRKSADQSWTDWHWQNQVDPWYADTEPELDGEHLAWAIADWEKREEFWNRIMLDDSLSPAEAGLVFEVIEPTQAMMFRLAHRAVRDHFNLDKE